MIHDKTRNSTLKSPDKTRQGLLDYFGRLVKELAIGKKKIGKKLVVLKKMR